MARSRFLRVKNLEKYQHYSDRTPPWVKMHRDFISDYQLRRMPEITRLFFACSWILASETGNCIPYDCDYLTQRVGFTVSDEMITPLIERGLMLAVGASKSLACCKQVATTSPLLSSSSLNPPNPEKSEHSKTSNGKASVLPPDFAFDQRATDLAVSFGLNPHKEFAAFKDHAAAKGRLTKDWQAAFRNWLRNSVKFKETRR